MNVKFILRGVELNPAEQEELVRRAETANAQGTASLDAMEIVLEDINGPRGGVDKVCRLILHRQGEPVVILQERGEQVMTTGLKALERAAQVMARRRELPAVSAIAS